MVSARIGEIWLILIYAKSKLDSISCDQLRKVKHEIEKPLTDKELEKFEASRDLGTELLKSVRQMMAGKGRIVLSPVISARKKSGLSQSEFAKLLGVSLRTL